MQQIIYSIGIFVLKGVIYFPRIMNDRNSLGLINFNPYMDK